MWKKRTGAPAPSTWGSTAIKSWNAEPGRQRASDPHRPRHADGQPDAPVLAAGAAGLRAARAGRPAAARARAGGGPDRVSRQRRPGRAAGGELPAPRGPAVLRAQRRRRTAASTMAGSSTRADAASRCRTGQPTAITGKSCGPRRIGAQRDAGDRHYWRITQLVLPFYVFVPGAVGSPVHCNAWVPMDDEHTIVWRIQYLQERPFTAQELAKLQSGMGAHVPRDEYLPASSEPAGAWRPRANRGNNYLQALQVQRTRSFSGIRRIS